MVQITLLTFIFLSVFWSKKIQLFLLYAFPLIVYLSLVFFIRIYLYGINIAEAVTLRFPIVFTAFTGATILAVYSKNNKLQYFKLAILASCFIQVSIAFFSNLTKGMHAKEVFTWLNILTTESIREHGTLLNANAYSYFVLIGLIILSSDIIKSAYESIGIKRLLIKWGIFIYYSAGIFLSLSRLPILLMAFIVLFTCFYSLIILSKLHKTMMLMQFGVINLVLFAFLIFWVITDFQTIANSRIFSTSAPRIDKIQIGFQIITNSMTNFLVGESARFIVDYKMNNLLFSDNSYLYFSIQFGAPAGLLLIFLFIYFMTDALKQKNLFLFSWVLYVALVFFMTNAIIIESFLLYIPITWFILSKANVINHRTNFA